MKFPPESLMPYLNGKSFDAFLRISIGSQKMVTDRRSTVLRLVEGRSVLHVGCCDHQPLIADKLKAGRWLHKLLTDASERTLGVDIDQEAVEYVCNEIGYDNIVYGDMTADNPISAISEGQWDYAVFGEILEHVDDPVVFLRSVFSKYRDCIGQVVITVPNAFAWRNFQLAAQGAEQINTDHRYWFTPYTLAKVMVRAGIQPVELYYADPHYRAELGFRILKRLRLAGKFYRDHPAFSNTLVAIGKL